jgi:hypothetical protein
MARNDDGNRISAIRESHGARRGRPADLKCQGAVGDNVPDWDATQCVPDCPLEISAIGSSRQAGDGVQVSFEIGLKRTPRLRGDTSRRIVFGL